MFLTPEIDFFLKPKVVFAQGKSFSTEHFLIVFFCILYSVCIAWFLEHLGAVISYFPEMLEQEF